MAAFTATKTSKALAEKMQGEGHAGEWLPSKGVHSVHITADAVLVHVWFKGYAKDGPKWAITYDQIEETDQPAKQQAGESSLAMHTHHIIDIMLLQMLFWR